MFVRHVCIAILVTLLGSNAFAAECKMSHEYFGSGNTSVWKSRQGPLAFYFRSNSDVNTDGSGRSYHPDDIAGNMGLAQNTICNGMNRKVGGSTRTCYNNCQKCLDHFRSVSKETMIANFTQYFDSFAVATDDGKACVVPEGQPNAGFFVSTTSYTNAAQNDVCDPARYLDAMLFPAIAVPKSLLNRGVKQGDYVLVRNRKNGRSSFGVVNDSSGSRIGESSIAMNLRLLCKRGQPGCVPPDMPTTLRQSYGLVVEDADYLIFANSVGAWPASPDAVDAAARGLFDAWGGASRLDACASAYSD